MNEDVNEKNLGPVIRLVRALAGGSPRDLETVLSEPVDLKAEYKKDETFRLSPPIESISLSKYSDEVVIAIYALLLDYGFDVNELDEYGHSALTNEVSLGHFKRVAYLLGRGADPNIRNPLRTVVNSQSSDKIAMAKLLLDHGANVNQIDTIGTGDKVTALDWARGNQELEALFRSVGGKSAREILGPSAASKQLPSLPSDKMRRTVSKYFGAIFGKPIPLSIQSVVPDPFGVQIEWIPAGSPNGLLRKRSPTHVLFTNGLSQHELYVPHGHEEFRFAELNLQLPATWPPADQSIRDPRYAWPIIGLKNIANEIVATKGWLGDKLTVIGNDEPPRMLGPDCPFCGWLVMIRHKHQIKKGIFLASYSCFPIYPEEYAFARSHGAGELAMRLAAIPITDAIDLGRKNVGI